ncbi:MAG: DapH/DapD/GlmU-related protein [Rubripirellula sp.]
MDVFMPRDTVSDDACRLVEVHVSQGQSVKTDDLLFTFESSKSTFEVHAETDGVIQWTQLVVDEFYPVGDPVATITGKDVTNTQPDGERLEQSGSSPGKVHSRQAAALIDSGRMVPDSQLRFISSRDFSSDSGNSESDSELTGQTDDTDNLDQQLNQLRRQMRNRFDRHVPTGTLLNDRWELAQRWGFGESSSCYDECLILGDVQVGRDCWIGPFTILDGAHAALKIGDHSSIGAGTHVYTHDTIAQTLAGELKTHSAPTTIGKRCFISPQVIIAPGTKLGDRCFVAAGAYVQGVFPDESYIAGNPAKQEGHVEITDHGFRIRKSAKESGSR